MSGDSRRVTTVDLATAAPVGRAIVFRCPCAVVGRHTIWIRVLGTAGRPPVGVDGFIILR